MIFSSFFMGAPVRDLADRFWEKVLIIPFVECWIWTAGKSNAGYGVIGAGHRGGKQMLAHRLSYEFHKGKIPEGYFVCHKCDNPACVNPSHLFAGTPKQNSMDMAKKGRAAKPDHAGSKHPSSKFTELQVIAIRKTWDAGEKSQHELAREYGVSRSAIQSLTTRRAWKHVKEKA